MKKNQDGLSLQVADFYDMGINKLAEHYDKCLNKKRKLCRKIAYNIRSKMEKRF